MSKVARHCEGCRQEVPARFRTLADLFLCVRCYEYWLATGTVPTATLTWQGAR